MAATFGGRGGRRRTRTGRERGGAPFNPFPPTASLGLSAATRAVLVCLLVFCIVCFLPPGATAATAAATTTTITSTNTTRTSAATVIAADTDLDADASITSTATAATTTPSIAAATTPTTVTATTTTATVVKPAPYSDSAIADSSSRADHNDHQDDHQPGPHPHPHRTLAKRKKNKFLPDKKVGDDGSQCWLFTHMPKSGGSTIRDMLKEKWGMDKFIKYGNPEWKYGRKKAKDILNGKYRIFAGSHAEALRRYGGERCQGFTMFRHPIPRVVSAYFYCKKVPIDPLCATSVMKAKDVDLLTFVQHWGNFGLRLFSLSMGDTDPNDIMDWAKNAKPSVGASGWYLQRKYMEAHSEPHDAPDSPLYSMLAPAKEHLNSSSFAAVGILENFEASLSLYDSALQMPGDRWHQWYAKIGPRNVDKEYKQEEEEALESAWTDSRFEYFLMLDLMLYDHAVKVHNEQLERYGLVSEQENIGVAGIGNASLEGVLTD